MDHYLEIRVLPDAEFGPEVGLADLFERLHSDLAGRGVTDIGISFPGYSKRPKALGTRLRIHGKRQAIDALMAQPWLKGVQDQVLAGGVSSVPGNAKHCVFRRRQFRTSAERLRRRYVRRHGVSPEEAQAIIPDSVCREPNLPYVIIRSVSTRQRFSLFFEQGPIRSTGVPGVFNSYGLSSDGATVPWF